jgi:hypothetical protein
MIFSRKALAQSALLFSAVTLFVLFLFLFLFLFLVNRHAAKISEPQQGSQSVLHLMVVMWF